MLLLGLLICGVQCILPTECALQPMQVWAIWSLAPASHMHWAQHLPQRTQYQTDTIHSPHSVHGRRCEEADPIPGLALLLSAMRGFAQGAPAGMADTAPLPDSLPEARWAGWTTYEALKPPGRTPAPVQ